MEEAENNDVIVLYAVVNGIRESPQQVPPKLPINFR
jgi:hypothetical protein